MTVQKMPEISIWKHEHVARENVKQPSKKRSLNFSCTCLVQLCFFSSTLYVSLFPQISQRASPRRIIQAVGPQEGTNFGTKPKPVPFLRSHAGKKWQKNLRLRLSPPLLVFVTALHLLENCCFNKVQFHPTMTTFAFCGWKKPKLAQKKSQSWFNLWKLPHHLHVNSMA